jgi:hypothetical protein
MVTADLVQQVQLQDRLFIMQVVAAVLTTHVVRLVQAAMAVAVTQVDPIKVVHLAPQTWVAAVAVAAVAPTRLIHPVVLAAAVFVFFLYLLHISVHKVVLQVYTKAVTIRLLCSMVRAVTQHKFILRIFIK